MSWALPGTNIISALLGTLVSQHVLVFLYRKLCLNAVDTLLRPSDLFRLVLLNFTVPAYDFNNSQWRATKDAATITGTNVLYHQLE
jgi:hypothetical protein